MVGLGNLRVRMPRQSKTIERGVQGQRAKVGVGASNGSGDEECHWNTDRCLGPRGVDAGCLKDEWAAYNDCRKRVRERRARIEAERKAELDRRNRIEAERKAMHNAGCAFNVYECMRADWTTDKDCRRYQRHAMWDCIAIRGGHP